MRTTAPRKTARSLALASFIAIAFAGAAGVQANDHGHENDGFMYSRYARPYGKSMWAWADRSMQWLFAQPLEHNPLIDQTGMDCGVGQEGPVWFIPPIASAAPGDFSRTCNVPRGKAIFLMAGYFSDPWPCPDPNFKPAPGQSLYDFLTADAAALAAQGLNFARLDIVLDGRRVQRERDYQFASENLFAYKGHPSLNVLDPCITGNYQPSVTNGYFYMFKPLRPGRHVLVRTSVGAVSGRTNRFTYYLNVR